jgi:hypothetical protein
MSRIGSITHEFVEFIPANLKDGTIYVSIPYATVVHKCFCGCGQEVVTPLNPMDWKLIFDGKTISLDPSIGNWSFECRSHYWIKCNRVVWVRPWSQEEVRAGRICDKIAKEEYFGATATPTGDKNNQSQSIWKKLRNWFS